MDATILHYHELHDQALARLNEYQRKAVLQIEGPVLVLAGPGTGKTEVLAVRIGQILREQDVQAGNILCLTFSNAAVDAMRSRLKKLIGPIADQVAIHTYHGFSNQLIQQYNQSRTQGRKLITDAQKYMLLEKLLYDYFSPNNPEFLKPASKKKINDISGIFATLKQEGITTAQIQQYATYCIEHILSNEADYIKKDGDLNAKGRDLKQRIASFAKDYAYLYEQYGYELSKRNMIEFEDMLVEAVEILQNDADTRAGMQEKYLYILVDEFQDTNQKQLDLIKQLVYDNDSPNLFVVGDDDQCIYRFQGATSTSIDWIRETYTGILKVIALAINYRSTDLLLRETFALIKQNQNRPQEKQSPLVMGNDNYRNIQQPLPRFSEYHNEEQEVLGVVISINKSLSEHRGKKSIAILARKHGDLVQYKRWLDLAGISWKYQTSWLNLLDTFYGKAHFYLIQFLAKYDAQGDKSSPFLVELMLHRMESDLLIKSYLECKNVGERNYFSWLRQQYSNDTRLKEFIQYIDQLLAIRNNPINTEMLALIEKAVLAGMNMDSPDDYKNAWDKFTDNFLEVDKDKSVIDLADLLWFYHQAELPIKISIPVEEEDPYQASVTLSTIHASKGLEFDEVYVVNCNSKNWESQSGQGRITVPKFLNRYISPEPDSLDDMRKLLYVAITRAKTTLHVSFYKDTASGKSNTQTILLNEFGKSSGIALQTIEPVAVPKVELQLETLQLSESIKELVQQKLTAFEISPTSTGAWAECQNKFLFTQVLKIGGLFSEAPSFGTVVHNVLQRYALSVKARETSFNLQAVIGEEMAQMKHMFHSTRYEKYVQYALWLIPDYLRTHPITNANMLIEETFKTTLASGAKIKGKLDRVELAQDSAKVVDYKTGRRKQGLTPFEDYDHPGTQYWRQAMIYQLLVKNNFQDKLNIGFEFHYPEIGYTVAINEERNELFEQWLTNLWRQIQAQTFNKYCNNNQCIYCANAKKFYTHYPEIAEPKLLLD